MNRSILVGICSGAVGMLLGLLIAVLVEPTLGQVRAERDELRADRDKLIKELGEARSDKQRGEQELAETKKALSAQLEGRTHCTVVYLKSQALLGLLIKVPETRLVVLTEEFRKQFKPDWFMPDEALRMIGGKWFLDEMRECGMLTPEGTLPEPTQWREVKRWQVVGSKNTETFQVSSPVWRIAWKTDQQVGVLIKLYDRKGQMLDFAAGKGTGETYIRQPPGEFHLEITALMARSIVWVEEPR